MERELAAVGGQLRRLDLRERMLLVDDLRLQEVRRATKAEHPAEEVDLRFPVQSQGRGRVADANRNILRLFRALELLWWQMQSVEAAGGWLYDYAFFLRDDIWWIRNFNLSRLLLNSTAADAYVLSCDARSPPMLPSERNDHAVLLRRAHAAVYGEYYSSLFTPRMRACRVELSKKPFSRGCNSEEMFKWALTGAELRVREVGQALLPFQRSAHVRTQRGVVACFHKFCNSFADPLPPSSLAGVPRCNSLRTQLKARAASSRQPRPPLSAAKAVSSQLDWSRCAAATDPGLFGCAGFADEDTATPSSTGFVTEAPACGFCRGSATERLLREVAMSLRAFEGECRDFVAYSVSFHHQLSELAVPPASPLNHSNCFFSFVLMPTARKVNGTSAATPFDLLPMHGRTHRVAVDRSFLPSNNGSMRRNVKIFKLLGHRLFPWARALLWMDGKLRPGRQPPQTFYSQYLLPTGACAAFMGLPPP